MTRLAESTQYGRKIIIPHEPKLIYLLERTKDGKGDIFGGRAEINQITKKWEPVAVTLGRELLTEGQLWLTGYDHKPIHTSTFYPQNEDKGFKVIRDVYVGGAVGQITLNPDEHRNWAAATLDEAIKGDYNLDDTTREMLIAQQKLINVRIGYYALR
jgi:hypothetical protein